jgi:hypothetical protein
VPTVINVIASEATVTGDSDQPGHLEGYGVIDAEQVRELADTAMLQLVECPTVTPEEATGFPLSGFLTVDVGHVEPTDPGTALGLRRPHRQ